MTLSTQIIIAEPVPAESLFHFVRCDLLGARAHRFEQRNSDGENVFTSWGVGLASQVIVTYRPDAMMQHVCDEDCEPPDHGVPTLEPYALELYLDTAYGYRAGDADCGDLHAWIVREVAGWLRTHGARRWWFSKEYDGTWHTQDESPTILGWSKPASPDRGALVRR